MLLDPHTIQNHKISSTLINKALELKICALSIVSPSVAIKGEKDFNEKKHLIPNELSYLNNNTNVRNNPCLILDNCKNVLCVAISYHTLVNFNEQLSANHGKISSYALGRDYHKVLKNKLNALGQELSKIIPNLKYRAIVDSAPFYEKFFAQFSKNGIIGNNSLVRINNIGSTVFLGELLIDYDLITELKPYCLQTDNNLNSIKTNKNEFTLQTDDSDQNFIQFNLSDYVAYINKGNIFTPKNNECPIGCNICKKACPTKSIDNDVLDIKNCISFLTIEYKNFIPLNYWKQIGTKIYGCDSCQSSCPINKSYIKKIPSLFNDSFNIKDFTSRYNINFLDFHNLLQLKESDFNEIFKGSPILRIRYPQFMRNVIIASTNSLMSTNERQELISLYDKLYGISEIVDKTLDAATLLIKNNNE